MPTPAGVNWTDGTVNVWYWAGLVIILGILFLRYGRARRARKRLGAIGSTYRVEVPDPAASSVVIPTSYMPVFSAVRPRRIGVTASGWFSLLTIVTGLVVAPILFWAFQPLDSAARREWAFLCLLGLPAMARQVWWIVSMARLLRHGEAATARITGTGRFLLTGQVWSYEFGDAEGRTYRASTVVSRRASKQGAPEAQPVFYDPSDPTRNFLLAATVFAVLPPTEHTTAATNQT